MACKYKYNDKWFTENELIYLIGEKKNLLDISNKQALERLNSLQEVFKQSSELQSIGTIFDYDSYLNTIFPYSKVKDIVYHGTDKQFEEFDDKKRGSRDSGLYGLGFYFTKYEDYAQDYAEVIDEKLIQKGIVKVLSKGVILKAILNIENPYYKEKTDISKSMNEILSSNISIDVNKLENDGVIEPEGTETMVKSGSQIHILGSKKDIEGFKEFVSPLKSLGGINLGNASQEVQDKLKGFLFAMNPNFDLQVLDKVEGAEALALISEFRIQLEEGTVSRNLAEETAHFYFELLKPGNPLKKQMLDNITNTKIYQQTFDLYSQDKSYQNADGTPNIDRIKREACAKLIAGIVNGKNLEELISRHEKPQDFFRRLVYNIFQYFRSFSFRGFQKAADEILAGDISRLDIGQVLDYNSWKSLPQFEMQTFGGISVIGKEIFVEGDVLYKEAKGKLEPTPALSELFEFMNAYPDLFENGTSGTRLRIRMDATSPLFQALPNPDKDKLYPFVRDYKTHYQNLISKKGADATSTVYIISPESQGKQGYVTLIHQSTGIFPMPSSKEYTPLAIRGRIAESDSLNIKAGVKLTEVFEKFSTNNMLEFDKLFDSIVRNFDELKKVEWSELAPYLKDEYDSSPITESARIKVSLLKNKAERLNGIPNLIDSIQKIGIFYQLVLEKGLNRFDEGDNVVSKVKDIDLLQRNVNYQLGILNTILKILETEGYSRGIRDEGTKALYTFLEENRAILSGAKEAIDTTGIKTLANRLALEVEMLNENNKKEFQTLIDEIESRPNKTESDVLMLASLREKMRKRHIDPAFFEDMLRGNRGDLDLVGSLLVAARASGDPIIASIQQVFEKVSLDADIKIKQALRGFQDKVRGKNIDIETLYESMTKLYPTFTVKEIYQDNPSTGKPEIVRYELVTKDEKGNVLMDRFYISQFNPLYLLHEKEKWIPMKNAELDWFNASNEDKPAKEEIFKQKQKEYYAWVDKNMHRRYSSEFYQRYKDIAAEYSQEAVDAAIKSRNDVLQRIDAKKKVLLALPSNLAEVTKQKNELMTELKRLTRETNRDGSSRTPEEIQTARILKAIAEVDKNFYEYKNDYLSFARDLIAISDKLYIPGTAENEFVHSTWKKRKEAFDRTQSEMHLSSAVTDIVTYLKNRVDNSKTQSELKSFIDNFVTIRGTRKFYLDKQQIETNINHLYATLHPQKYYVSNSPFTAAEIDEIRKDIKGNPEIIRHNNPNYAALSANNYVEHYNTELDRYEIHNRKGNVVSKNGKDISDLWDKIHELIDTRKDAYGMVLVEEFSQDELDTLRIWEQDIIDQQAAMRVKIENPSKLESILLKQVAIYSEMLYNLQKVERSQSYYMDAIEMLSFKAKDSITQNLLNTKGNLIRFKMLFDNFITSKGLRDMVKDKVSDADYLAITDKSTDHYKYQTFLRWVERNHVVKRDKFFPMYAYTKIVPVNNVHKEILLDRDYKDKKILDKHLTGDEHRTVFGKYVTEGFNPKNPDYIESKYAEIMKDKDTALIYKEWVENIHIKIQRDTPSGVKLGYKLPYKQKMLVEKNVKELPAFWWDYLVGKVNALEEGDAPAGEETPETKKDLGFFNNLVRDLKEKWENLTQPAKFSRNQVPTLYTTRINQEEVTHNFFESTILYTGGLLETNGVLENLPVYRLTHSFLQQYAKTDEHGQPLTRNNRLKRLQTLGEQNLFGKKVLSNNFMDKFMRTLQKILVFKTQSILNPLGNFKNIESGLISNYINNTDGHQLKAQGLAFKNQASIFDQLISKNKKLDLDASLVQMLNPQQEQITDLFSMGMKKANYLLQNSWYAPMHLGEMQISLQYMYNMLLSLQVLHKGQEKSLYAALQENWKIKESIEYEDLLKGIQRKEGVDFTKDDIFRLRRAMADLKYRTQGITNDSVAAKQHVLGRVMLFMQSYIVPSFINNWGNTRINLAKGEWQIGYQRMWVDVFKSMITAHKGKLAHWNYLTEREQRDSIRAIKNLSWVLLVTMLLWLGLGYDWDDDDKNKGMEDNNLVHNWAIYTTIQTLNEIETMNAYSFKERTSPLVFENFRMITNGSVLKKQIAAFESFLHPFDTYERDQPQHGIEEGDSKLLRTIMTKYTPLPRLMNTINNPEYLTKTLESMDEANL